MSTDQFDPEQVVRIRMTCAVPKGANATVWSDLMPRRIAEVDVAGGPYHLSLEHAGGLLVLSAAIVPWKGN